MRLNPDAFVGKQLSLPEGEAHVFQMILERCGWVTREHMMESLFGKDAKRRRNVDVLESLVAKGLILTVAVNGAEWCSLSETGKRVVEELQGRDDPSFQ